MRLLPSGDVAACLPAPLGEQGRTRSGHRQLPWSGLQPPLLIACINCRKYAIFNLLLLTKHSAGPTASCHGSDRAGTGFARRATAGYEVTGFIETPSHRARPEPRLFSGNAVSGRRKRLPPLNPARRRELGFLASPALLSRHAQGGRSRVPGARLCSLTGRGRPSPRFAGAAARTGGRSAVSSTSFAGTFCRNEKRRPWVRRGPPCRPCISAGHAGGLRGNPKNTVNYCDPARDPRAALTRRARMQDVVSRTLTVSQLRICN